MSIRRLLAVVPLVFACSQESSDRLPAGSPQLHLKLYGTEVEGVVRVELPLDGIDAYVVDEPGEATAEPRAASGGRWFPLATEGGLTITERAKSPWDHGVRRIPPSRPTQFRLRFRPGSKVRIEKADGAMCALDPASLSAEKWLVSAPFRARPVTPGETWEYVLRIDVARSLSPDGKGCFLLDPVLVVERIARDGVELPLR